MKIPNTMKYIFSLIIFILTLLIVELFLRLFLPFNFATIGHVYSKNARLYGWGYNPYEIIKTHDPDTGAIYSHPANNRGWRDKDRAFINHNNNYRILVLGDSFTFGAIVPAEKVYTRILEDKLQKDGFDVEVINMAYGGWGTDQELEALKNEGLKYKPNLVIMQFHLNDLKENMDYENDQRNNWKPFFYTINDEGHLFRNNNPHFHRNWELKDKIKYNILKSEIGKRLYSIYFIHKWKETPSRKNGNLIEEPHQKEKYFVTKNQIDQLELCINLDRYDQITKFLMKNIDKEIDIRELNKIIMASSHKIDKETLFRVLEKRSFHNNWSKKIYYPKKQDINSYSWKLYFALIEKANSLVIGKGAKLVIFCHNDIAQYEWNVNWCRISNDLISRTNFLQYRKIIHDYLKKHQIDFIKNKRAYQFARNDPHPNIEGNKEMANDIYDYLMENKLSDLNQYRIKHLSTQFDKSR